MYSPLTSYELDPLLSRDPNKKPPYWFFW